MTITRQIMQVEGYELDYIWYLAQAVEPILTLPEDCPTWALDMWEAVLRIPGRDGVWSVPERRASILSRVTSAVLEAEVKQFIATEARCATSALAFGYTVDYQVDITTTGLSGAQVAAVAAASQLVIPAHMKITVDAGPVR